MTSGCGSRVRLDDIGGELLAVLREEAHDWLITKADDLPKGSEDAETSEREVEEVAALGRLASGLRRGKILVPDPMLRELAARTTSETRHLDALKEEYDRVLAEHEGWTALLARLDSAPDTPDRDDEDRGAEPESPGHEEPVASSTPELSGRIEPVGRFSDDQLQIIRTTVTRALAGRTGDLQLTLRTRPEIPEREVGEIAALARIAFGLERGELMVPDRIARDFMTSIAADVAHENEVEEIVERYQEGIAEHEALVAFAAIFSEGSPQGGGDER